jgi:hypothetical protein
MRNADAGQEFGNRLKIRPLTEESFQLFILPRLQPTLAVNLSEYQLIFPENTHYAVVWRDDYAGWQFIGVGSQEELESEPRQSLWAVELQDFQSGQAVSHGKTPDSEAELFGNDDPADRKKIDQASC